MARLKISPPAGIPFTFDAHGAVSLEIPPGREAEVDDMLVAAIEALRDMPAAEEVAPPEQRVRAPLAIGAMGGIRPPPAPPGLINTGSKRPAGMPAPPTPPTGAVSGVTALPQPEIKRPPPPPSIGPAAQTVAPRVRSQHPNQPSSHRARPRIGPVAPSEVVVHVAEPIPAPMPAAAMPMNPPNQEGEAIIGANGQPLRGAPMAALPQAPILAPPPPPDR